MRGVDRNSVRGFCELRVIGLLAEESVLLARSREEFGGLEMGEDFFGRETGALLDGGSERALSVKTLVIA